MVGLTLKEAVEFSAYIKESYGIEPAAGGVAMMAGPAGGGAAAAAPAAEEKTTFNVVLKAAGEKKINVIKVVRAATNLGLKEAKEPSGTPRPSRKLPKADADKLKKELEEQGATVELK